MKKCYSCGAAVPDESKFCPKCGKPIKVTQDLINRAKENDSEAQAELYERTYKTVYSRIRAKVPDNDTTMDIMQEVYLNAFTNLNQLQTAESFPSWLLTIASRQVCAWYRKNGKENENVQMSRLEYENDNTMSDEDDLLEQPEYREDFSPDESLDRAETGRLLSEILDTLPEDQRIILTMRYYDEMSLKEISDELGVNLSTVKTRLTAGKKKVEAKVLELEKSGPRLYSLGPVAFLVFLLHHMELFAPAIPADTIIGLTAAGAAGAGGAAATAAHVTAGAAAKTAVAAAAKGVSVKVIAIVAAAVVVVGGGATATVLLSQPSGTASAESAETAQTASVVLTPEETPTAEENDDKVDLEPSESPDDADVTEEAAESNTDAPEETPSPESIPDPPSEDVITNLTSGLSYWAVNAMSDWENEDTTATVGPINMTLERAGLLAAYESEPGDTIPGVGIYISDDELENTLHNLFGSEYQLSDLRNAVSHNQGVIDQSEFIVDNCSNTDLFLDLFLYNDQFCLAETGNCYTSSCSDMAVRSIEKSAVNDNGYTATIDYMKQYYVGEYEYDSGSPVAISTGPDAYATSLRTFWFEVVPDSSSEYGWIITQITYDNSFHDA